VAVAPDALTWIAARLPDAGPVELLHERPWASVWRVPVGREVAWFKACAPPHAFEAGLTAALASRRPGLVADVLAADAERGWLLLADAGEAIGLHADLAHWLSLLPRYAELQRSEAAHAGEHLRRGSPDRRLAAFPALFDGMLARDLPLADGDRVRLARFQGRFAALCEELDGAGLPDTVQHDDLHGLNVSGSPGDARILDWGDSCVSHPFLTSFVTFDHLDAIGGDADTDGAGYRRLRDAYLEPWGRADELREAFDLAYRLGAFAHVFKELHVFDAVPEPLRRPFAPDLPPVLEGCLRAAARLSP
jgi:hypothetical protein